MCDRPTGEWTRTNLISPRFFFSPRSLQAIASVAASVGGTKSGWGNILLTGSTGFVGKMLLMSLLDRTGDGFIYLAIRGDPMLRLADLFNDPGLQSYRSQQHRLKTVQWDIEAVNLGLCDADLDMLTTNVQLVINCAGVVKFDQTQEQVDAVNVTAACALRKLFSRVHLFVHVSTAYVNTFPEVQVPGFQITEQLHFPMGMVPPTSAFPNTYACSKAKAEFAMTKLNNENSEFGPLLFLRPSIVSYSAIRPYPGWGDSKDALNTYVYLIGIGLARLMRTIDDGNMIIDVVPVDIVASVTVSAIEKSFGKPGVHFAHATTSTANPVTIRTLINAILTYFTANPPRFKKLKPKMHYTSSASFQSKFNFFFGAVAAVTRNAKLIKLAAINKKLDVLFGFFTTHPLCFHSTYISEIQGFNWDDYWTPYFFNLEKVLGQVPKKPPELHRQPSLATVPSPSRRGVVLAFDKLQVIASGGQTILHSVSGHFYYGEMTAILGASGSGKSSLLRALHSKPVGYDISGMMCLQGKVFNAGHVGPKLVGLVPQTEALQPNLTVRETLLFAALLTDTQASFQMTPRDTVDYFIASLGLAAVADTFVGSFLYRGLSTGEKRRLSIGVALMSWHSVLLLDEPLSGLDASGADSIARLLQRYAVLHDCAIVAVVHQPSPHWFSCFNHVMFMDSGRIVFHGPPAFLHDYMSNHGITIPEFTNDFDCFLQVLATSPNTCDLNSTAPSVFQEKYQASRLFADNQAVIKLTFAQSSKERQLSAKSASIGTQFRALMWRKLLDGRRDILLHYTQSALLLFFALLIGLLFLQLSRVEENLLLYSSGVVWIFVVTTMVNVYKSHHIIDQQRIFQHEVQQCMYGVPSYALTDFLLQLPITICIVSPAVVLMFFLIGLPLEALDFFLLVLLISYQIADSIVWLLCALLRQPGKATIAAVILLLSLVINCGHQFINAQKVPHWIWVWLRFIDFYVPAGDAVLFAIFHKMTFTCDLTQYGVALEQIPLDRQCATVYGTLDCGMMTDPTHCKLLTDQILDVVYGIDSSLDKWMSVVHIVIYWSVLVVLRIVALFAMSRSSGGWDHASKIARASVPTAAVATSVVTENKVEFVVQHEHSYRLQWTQLCATVKPGSHLPPLLQNCSGEIACGKMLAVMGPSGSGKTTFLSILSGQHKLHVSGDISLADARLLSNGHVTAVNPALQGVQLVTHENCLDEQLTVFESLFFVAQMRHPNASLPALSGQPRVPTAQEITEFVLTELGLQHLRDRNVGGTLSGGERKRLSIGIALVALPRLLLLDEVTTGLDGHSSLSLVSLIHKLAVSLNIIVVCAIHQPNSHIFNLFDALMFLKLGRLSFFGSPNMADSFFASLGVPCPIAVNPADWYMGVLSNMRWEAMVGQTPEVVHALQQALQRVGDIAHEFAAWNFGLDDESVEDSIDQLDNSAHRQLVTSEKAVLRAAGAPSLAPSLERAPLLGNRPQVLFHLNPEYSVLNQIAPLTHRSFVHHWRHPLGRLQLFLLLLFGVYMGLMFRNLPLEVLWLREVVGSIFVAPIGLMLVTIAEVPFLITDKVRIEQELANGHYDSSVFWLSTLLVGVPWATMKTLAVTIPVFFLAGHPAAHYGFFFFAWFLVSLCMDALVAILGRIISHEMIGSTIGTVTVATFSLFSGFYVARSDMPDHLRWISFVCPTSYSFTAVLVDLLGANYWATPRQFMVAGSEIWHHYFQLAEAHDKTADLVMIIVLAVFLRVVHFTLLRFAFRDSRSWFWSSGLVTGFAVGAAIVVAIDFFTNESNVTVPLQHTVTVVNSLVIGSGFGGSMAALRLGQAGISTFVLERGRAWPILDPTTDATFPDVPDSRWAWFSRFTLNNPDFANPISVGTGLLDRLGPKINNADPTPRCRGESIQVEQVVGVGGGSLAYCGIKYYPRRDIVSRSWALDSSHNYTSVLDELFNGGYLHDARATASKAPGDLQRSDVFAEARSVLADAAEAGFPLGDPLNSTQHRFSDWLSVEARWDRLRGEINGTLHPSLIGPNAFAARTNSGARRTLADDDDILGQAVRTGYVTVKPLHVVTRITRDPVSGTFTVTSVELNVDGSIIGQRDFVCHSLFMAAGSVQTSNLLVRARAKGDLPLLNKHVGTRFSTNGNMALWYFTNNTSAKQLPHRGRSGPASASVAYLDGPVDEHDPIVLENLPLRYPHHLNPQIWWPRDEAAFCAIVGVPSGGYGQFRFDAYEDSVVLHWPTDPRPDQGVYNAARWLVTELDSAAGRASSSNASLPRPGPILPPIHEAASITVQPLGGVPLGLATDDYCGIKEYAGLYVVDGSVMPGALGCNPTTTIQANADRCMKHIIAKAKP